MQAQREPVPAVFSERELYTLPAVVQRYFRTVLRPGQPLVANVLLQHSGTWSLHDTPALVPFTSWQCVTPQRPGFVWNAKVGGVVSRRIFDSYIAGTGLTDAAVLGLVSVGAAKGGVGDKFAAARLQRFLAEAVWYPTALLPSQGVEWTHVHEKQALAVLRDGEVSAAVTFEFDEAGRIASFIADGPDRMAGGVLVPTRSAGMFRDYAECHGILVPRVAEVSWKLESWPRAHWSARLESIGYEWAK
jgi:hypothetical protein